MKCEECEPLLYEYDLLDQAERLRIDDHIKNCAGCRTKLEEATMFKDTIASLSTKVPHQQHAAAFTERVMKAIEAPRSAPARSAFSFLFLPIPKLALTALSLVLVLLFFFEQKQIPQQNESMAARATAEVTLNTHSFLKTIRDAPPSKADNTLQALYACARLENCDNELVKNFKRKLQLKVKS